MSPDDRASWVVLTISADRWARVLEAPVEKAKYVPMPVGRTSEKTAELVDLMWATGRLILKNRSTGELAVCRPLKAHGAPEATSLTVSAALRIDRAYRQPSSRWHAERVLRPNLPPHAAKLVKVLRAP